MIEGKQNNTTLGGMMKMEEYMTHKAKIVMADSALVTGEAWQ